MAAGVTPPEDNIRNRLQPRPSVIIGQRVAGAHLGDIAFGMKTVAVLKGPLQTLGESGRDRAFARTRYAHHDQCTGRDVWFTVQAIPHQPRLDPPAGRFLQWSAPD